MLKIIVFPPPPQIDVWQSSKLDSHPMDIMVSPQYQEELKEILDAKHVPYHVMIEDVQALVDSQLKGVDTAADF